MGIDERLNKALIEAIREKALDDAVVRVTYDELKEEYGDDIFGTTQPKRAVDCVISQLKEMGISVETGKVIKVDKTTKNGFAVFKKISEQESFKILGL